jgi:hypothetical protein
MGIVTIAEPSAGEPLTVTDVNSTLSNFNTQASSIDGDNVHDQSLDCHNFVSECATEIVDQPYRIDSSSYVPEWITDLNTSTGFKKVGITSATHLTLGGGQTLDFTNYDHIARCHFGLIIQLPNTAGQDYELVQIPIHLEYTAANGVSGIFPRTRRRIVLSKEHADHHQAGKWFIRSVGISTHLNAAVSSGSLANFQLRLVVDPIQSLNALQVNRVKIIQIRGLNMFVETYKR